MGEKFDCTKLDDCSPYLKVAVFLSKASFYTK